MVGSPFTSIERSIYEPLLKQFFGDEIDEKLICEVIIRVGRRSDAGEDVLRNVLLLVNGLLHKDDPIDRIGSSLEELDEKETNVVKEKLKGLVFNN